MEEILASNLFSDAEKIEMLAELIRMYRRKICEMEKSHYSEQSDRMWELGHQMGK